MFSNVVGDKNSKAVKELDALEIRGSFIVTVMEINSAGVGMHVEISEVGLDASEEPILLELALEWIPRFGGRGGGGGNVDTLNYSYLVHSIGMLPGIPGQTGWFWAWEIIEPVTGGFLTCDVKLLSISHF
ncbi:hypothetical protein F2Q68_00016826 [Brassica cretica]|uniref:Uncharacterized protein n=1 Tax=Brassica cretica TaxID=69181 RepID=A0A8S9HGY5_BRACR|nr:hypothetical protein F2Q68_00016826 [Brassica cretica]